MFICLPVVGFEALPQILSLSIPVGPMLIALELRRLQGPPGEECGGAGGIRTHVQTIKLHSVQMRFDANV